MSTTLIDALRVNHNAQAVEAARDPTKVPPLAGAMKTFGQAWPLQTSKIDIIRASGLAYLCPREFVFNYWAPTANRSFDIRGQFLMGVGTYLHEVIQNTVLGPMGVLKGVWNKWHENGMLHWVPESDGRGGNVHHVGFHPDPQRTLHEVSNQQQLTWRYQEYTVADHHLRLYGHLDGIVSVPRIEFLSASMALMKADPNRCLAELYGVPEGDEQKLEIKTTGSFLYKGIRTANDIADWYKMQSNIYQRMYDGGSVKGAIFWYVNRDSMDSKMIPYWFEKSWWDQAVNKIRVIWEAIRDRTLPEAFKACRLPTDSRAKKCVFRDFCFNTWTPQSFLDWTLACEAKQPGRQFLDLKGKTW